MLSNEKPQKDPREPPIFTATGESLLNDTERLIEQSRRVQNEVIQTVQPKTATFTNVLLPLAQNENRVAQEWHVIRSYESLSPDPILRDASTEAKRLFDEFAIESALREDLFLLVDAVMKKEQDENILDVEDRLFLDEEHRRFLSNGLSLPAGLQRESFKRIKQRLSELSIAFRKNLNEGNGAIWFSLQELDGVPDDVLGRLERGQDGGENEGKLRLTFQYPDYFPAMSHARSSETRKKVYLGYENKCNQNVPLFKETIVLRDEAARLLNYPNHATFRLENKMIKSPVEINAFLEDLKVRLSSRGSEEIEVLKQLKKKDVGAEKYDGRYYLWDHGFYNRMMLQQQFQVDQQKISEFFPLERMVQGMLKIFETLFGLVFHLHEPKSEEYKDAEATHPHVWHEDVQLFEVWNEEAEGAGFVGCLYLDMYPRSGKFSHAANINIQPGFVNANGTRSYPVTALVCNFSKPTPTKPSLLKHEDLVTLFHELGHGIHDLVAKTKYSRFHGTMTVQDFCEAPSQMLEYLCWDPSQLQALSHHYLTGEKMPGQMIQRLVGSKNVNSGLFYLRQLQVSIFDLTIHQPESHEAAEKTDYSGLYNSLRQEITRLEGPDPRGTSHPNWGHGETTFFHLMSDYDAGYYGYLVSQVYALDLFHEVFEKDPKDIKEGRRYRHMILEKGGSQPAMKMLEDFLGRQPKSDRFYEELGLTQSVSALNN